MHEHAIHCSTDGKDGLDLCLLAPIGVVSVLPFFVNLPSQRCFVRRDGTTLSPARRAKFEGRVFRGQFVLAANFKIQRGSLSAW